MSQSPYMERAREGSLYILCGALLVGTLWNGGYFPTSKWTLTFLLLVAAGWELMITFAEGRRAGSLRSPALWLFLAFALYASASVLWTASAADTQRDAPLLIALGSVLFVVRGNLSRSRRRALMMSATWFVYVAAFVSAWGVITYLFRVSPYTNILEDIYRAGSSFEYSNALACFGLMALPVSAALYRAAASAERPWLGLAFSLQATAVVLSFSRAGIVALFLIGAFCIFAARRERLSLELFFAFAGGLVGAVIAVAASETGHPRIGLVLLIMLVTGMFLGHAAATGPLLRRSRSTVTAVLLAGTVSAGAVSVLAALRLDRLRLIVSTRYEEGLTWHRLLPHRLETWSGSIEALKARPVTGSGLGSFYYVYQQYAMVAFTKYAHNLILQMAVETGVIGAALFVVFLGYIVVISAWRLLRNAGTLTGAFALAALVFIGYNMFDWEWYVSALAAWFMLAAGCMEWPIAADVDHESQGT